MKNINLKRKKEKKESPCENNSQGLQSYFLEQLLVIISSCHIFHD